MANNRSKKPIELLKQYRKGWKQQFGARGRDRSLAERLRNSPGLWSRILLGVVMAGPGILVLLGGNDAGGMLTYLETGQAFGYSFFPIFIIFLIPMTYFVQEMTVRLGAVTQRGHAELIWGRFGPMWGVFSIADLALANIVTIATEFLGIEMVGSLFGIPVWISALGAVIITLSIIVLLKYFTWEKVTMGLAALNIVFIPLAMHLHPHWQNMINLGFKPSMLEFLVAIVGTTLAPWMLFFQQGSVVDKGMGPADIPAGRTDTMVGAILMTIIAGAAIVAGAMVGPGNIADLMRSNGVLVLFAIGILQAALISTTTLAASTSWSVSEVFNIPRSLNVSIVNSPWFYVPSIVSVLLGAAITLPSFVRTGGFNELAQILATLLMPAALLFLYLLANDRELLGDYVNEPWRNAIIIGIVSGLLILGGIYTLGPIF